MTLFTPDDRGSRVSMAARRLEMRNGMPLVRLAAIRADNRPHVQHILNRESGRSESAILRCCGSAVCGSKGWRLGVAAWTIAILNGVARGPTWWLRFYTRAR